MKPTSRRAAIASTFEDLFEPDPRQTTGDEWDFWLADQLVQVGLDPAALEPQLTRFDSAQRERKARVVAAYASQAPALGLSQTDLAASPGKLAYELHWRAASPPASS